MSPPKLEAEPEKLPVTILSRCQRYAFRRITVPVMIDKMKEVAGGEQIAIDDEALKAIAYRADGGLRDALTMLEQLAAFSAGQTATTGTLDLAFGSTGREFAATLVDAIVAGDATAALGAVEAASDAGADLTVLTRSLMGPRKMVMRSGMAPPYERGERRVRSMPW